MWLLRGLNALDESDNDEDDEDLRGEADELQAKLDAMRMADYREQMRAAVAKSSRFPVAQETLPVRAEQVQSEQSPTVSSSAVPSSFGASNLTDKFASVAQAELQPHRLRHVLAAEQALMRLRGELQTLREDSDKDGHRFDFVVAGLDEVQQELLQAQQDIGGLEQQPPPQEPPAKEPDPLEGIDRAQVVELAQVAEELTDALETARASEQHALDQVALVSQQLAAEAQRREAMEQSALALQLSAPNEQQPTQIAHFQALLADVEKQRDAETRRANLLQERAERVETESGLHKALASKGRSLMFRHLEV